MATAKVKQFWTAFVSVLFALLASLGLASPATAAQRTALQQGDEPATTPATAATTTARALASVPAPRSAPQWHTARGLALPPTIKQRIHAEAHGSSPSVRHLPADAPAAMDRAGALDLTDAALVTTAAAASAAAPAGSAAPAAQAA
ncbi:DUF6344 domain-containing protein [Streptomyces sp. NPDC126499]|uniref:DUF6344 domain-containing protein n=1 Tax=Streptomyces sp. NPDC126499 TaxID=3155314 RepID=UPI003323DD54